MKPTIPNAPSIPATINPSILFSQKQPSPGIKPKRTAGVCETVATANPSVLIKR